ncbi:MAG TPA: DNA methyltransferase [Anaerolineales bacterium]|nr:DNA methyltransferase [Anaerolineales bacterium]
MKLTKGNHIVLPEEFNNDHIRFSDSVVEFFLKEFTKEGDIVFEPFAGYGTTLLIAELMERIACGIEYTKRKAEYIRGLLKHPDHIIHGDSRRLLDYELPPFDLCLTSPPYTNKVDDENPFTDYTERVYEYSSYLKDIKHIFAQVAQKMKPSAHVVIEISNLKREREVTTLAWDVAREVSQILHFNGEIVLCWDKNSYGYCHSYCLVFSKE